MGIPMDPALAVERIEAIRKHKGNMNAAARELRIARSTVQSTVTWAISNGAWTGKVKDRPKLVMEERSPLSLGAAGTRLLDKDARRHIETLEQKVRDMEWAAKAGFEPAPWTYRAVTGKGRSPHIAYLLTSDFHVGEVVDDVDAGLDPYNATIFAKRYQTLVTTAIELATEHISKHWKIEGFVYARGGDSVSGSIHDELRETNDLTPMEAIEVCFENEAAGIRELHKQFGRVEVKTPGSGGNHDRDTLKMHHKRAAAHNYDRLIAFMLAREFRNVRGITFQTSPGFDVGYRIYNTNILLTHGDRIGSRGGMGFIGPAATILRGVQKVFAEQAALGNYLDRVDIGHFHYPMDLPVVLSNGSMGGVTEYGKMLRSRPLAPTQYLQFFNPKHGVVDSRPIKVAKLRRVG